jgi:hypothetical protein
MSRGLGVLSFFLGMKHLKTVHDVNVITLFYFTVEAFFLLPFLRYPRPGGKAIFELKIFK